MLPRAVFDKSKLWPNGSTLHVTFHRYTSNDTLDINLNAYIAKTITEKIAPYVGLQFSFHLQEDSTSGDIQIGYASDTNTHLMSIYGNKQGTDSLYTQNAQNVVSLYLYKPAIAPSNTTFLYNNETYTTPDIDQTGLPSDYIGMSILRNFCYALGMINEIRNPVGVSLSFDVNAIGSSFQQQFPTSSVTESMLRYFYSPIGKSGVLGSSYDNKSIMNYTTRSDTFLIQLSSYNTSLSACDKNWLMRVYPKSVYYLPYGESLYSIQQACSSDTASMTPSPAGGISGFEWREPVIGSDVYELAKAGQTVAEFDSTGKLSVPALRLSNPPSATAQGRFLSLTGDGSLAVDSSIQSFKQDLVGVVNGVIDRVNTLQSNQTNTFSNLSSTVQSSGSLLTDKLALYEQGYSNFATQTQAALNDYNERLLSSEQRNTQNRAHIDDLYLTQSTDRTNLTRYIENKTDVVQTDLNTKAGALAGRVTIVENILPPVRNQLDTLTDDMKNWADIQTNTQALQTQLIEQTADISARFDTYQTLESKFAQDILALNNRIAFTLDSFQSIQAVITQNYNNLAGQVLPAFAQIELLKSDTNFLKTSSYILIGVLAAIIIILLVYVFVSKKVSKGETT